MVWDADQLSNPEALSVEPHIDIHYDGGLAPLDLTKLQAFTDELTARAAGDASLQASITALTAALAALGHGLKAPGFATATSVSLSAAAFTSVASFSWVSSGGILIIVGLANVIELKSTGADFGHSFQLFRGSTGIGIGTTNRSRAPSDNVGDSQATLFCVEAPAAGTYTYSIQATYANISTSGTPTANGALLVAELSL